MTDTYCGHPGNRDEVLVAYLYDDIDPAERVSFEAHLLGCEQCRGDLEALRGVRVRLARWNPPAPVFAQAASAPSRWWRDIPAWAQVAAALLVLGVSAGIANLTVHWDATGLTVRTGWSSPAAAAAAPAQAAAAPWRADLADVERRLRTEFHAEAVGTAAPVPQPVGAQPAAAPAVSDAALLSRVRAIVADSEKRQQRELALRVAQVLRDVDAQRQADLIRIDRSLGQVQNNTGVEVMRQRELINYLVRASQKQ